MENRRGSGIFLSVIGVATLVVAIIGATFAYFSATAASNNRAIAVGSTEIDLGYSDVTDGLNTNMIPTASQHASYAALDDTWTDTSKKVNVIVGKDASGQDIVHEINAPGECIDQNGNEICSVYEFYVGNPSETTKMDIEASLTVAQNDFENLYFAIYDEKEEPVITETKFPKTGNLPLSKLTQTLDGYANIKDRTGNKDFSNLGDDGGLLAFDAKKPHTYQPNSATNPTNVRHYKMIIWIKETGSDQTKVDSGKIFAAGVTIKTAGASGGVTGVIAVANNQAPESSEESQD